MDDKRARELLRAERETVESLLHNAEAMRQGSWGAADEVRDSGDQAQALTAEGMDEALRDRLTSRLAAVERAERRLVNGTYGRSVRSGQPIPDDRLEADPTAELTVEEARSGQ